MRVTYEGCVRTFRQKVGVGLLVLAMAGCLWLLSGPMPVARVTAESAPGYFGSASQDAGPNAGLAAGTVIVNLNPATASVAKDAVFAMDVQLVAGSQLVDGAEVHLYFDKTYLQVVDAAGNPTGKVQSGGYLSQVLRNKVYTDTEQARIHFAAGIYDPEEPRPSGTFPLATVYFKALWGTGGGTTALVFGGDLPYKTEVTYGGESVLGSVQNGSVTISGDPPPVSPTVTSTPTHTPTDTQTRTPTSTSTHTPTATPLHSATPTNTATHTPSATITPTPTLTRTPTNTPTKTATATVTATPDVPPNVIDFRYGMYPDPSYTGVMDTHLTLDEPTTPHHTLPDLQLKNDANGGKRPLLRFDVSPIPPGSTVVAATLWLQQSTYKKNDLFGSTVRVYQVLRHWIGSEATWYKATSLQDWGVAGANADNDRSLTALDSVAVEVVTSSQWRTWNVRDAVQAWVNGSAQNEGLILVGTGSSQEFRFYSSDHPSADSRPLLRVNYYLPPPTPTPTNTPTPTVTPTTTPTNTPTPVPGLIIGMVWNDLNGNGAMEGGEPGLVNATLTLYQRYHAEPFRAPAVTSSNGAFGFVDLPPGWYTLLKTNPPGYMSTTDDSLDVLISSGVTLQISFGAWIPSTPTPTVTLTPTHTPSPTASATATHTATPTETLVTTATASPTMTATPTATPTLTATPAILYHVFLPIIWR